LIERAFSAGAFYCQFVGTSCSFTGHVPQHKLFCGRVEGLVKSLCLLSLWGVPSFTSCLARAVVSHFYPKGYAVENYCRRGVDSFPFRIVLKQQTLAAAHSNSHLRVLSGMDLGCVCVRDPKWSRVLFESWPSI